MRLASVVAAAMLLIAATAHAARRASGDCRPRGSASRLRIIAPPDAGHRGRKRESNQLCHYHQGALVSRTFCARWSRSSRPGTPAMRTRIARQYLARDAAQRPEHDPDFPFTRVRAMPRCPLISGARVYSAAYFNYEDFLRAGVLLAGPDDS